MNKSGIYKITNLANGKYYYGSSCNLKVRLNKHKSDLVAGRHDNKHLQAAYNKYGLLSFTFDIVLYCSVDNLLFYEQRFLDAFWDNSKFCYNLAKDAKLSWLGRTHTKETKEKMSKSSLGKPKSESAKKHMSVSGKNKKLSDAHKQKIAASSLGKQLGKIVSEETKQKISIAKTGKKINQVGHTCTEDTKIKISLSSKGKARGPMSEETKRKLSDKAKLRMQRTVNAC